MFVISVIPLIRGTRLETLSYFSAEAYEVGTILTVPIRGKQYQAITTTCTEVTSSKSNLRSAGYTLRKLPPQTSVVVLPSAVRTTALRLTEYYPASVGAILYHLLPPDVRTGTRPYPLQSDHIQSEDSTPQVLTARSSERFLSYHSLIRETFAHRGSVLLVCPTSVAAEQAAEQLRHGITERVTLITSTQGSRARDRAYAECADTSLARLIVTTPSFAYIDRVDFLSIIVDQCGSPYYQLRSRPYLDHRKILATYAAVTRRTILFGDSMPPSSLEYLRRSEIWQTYETEAKRIAFITPLTIITQQDHSTPEQPFTLFSPQLRKTIGRTLEGRGHVFFYGARRGLAPVVTCIDCGYLFRCPESHTPYSLLRTYKNGEETRWFVSSTSGQRVRAADICPGCGSWRLRERGIGIQHVYDEWRTAEPNYPVFLFDETTARTPRQAEKLIETFYSERAAVLIGTSMALPYITKPVAVSAVISLDATRSIPSWRADEIVFRLLLELREKSTQEVLLQTRQPVDDLLTYASRGALERFYDDELQLRQQLLYPPYAHLLLLTWLESAATQEFLQQTIVHFSRFNPQTYRSPNSHKDKPIRHILIRLSIDQPSDYSAALLLLRNLPAFVKIEIDPDRVV